MARLQDDVINTPDSLTYSNQVLTLNLSQNAENRILLQFTAAHTFCPALKVAAL